MDAILKLSDVSSGYGEVLALRHISLTVQRGEIFSVVGANGAGKSTLLLTISGHIQSKSGVITLDGQDISQQPAHQAAASGLVMVPEGGRLFPFMTVLENLELGAFHPAARAQSAQSLEMVWDLFPKLQERRQQLAGRLSGGERQMCAIARALMARPKLLLLDEPSLGLAPIMVEKIFQIVTDLVSQQGLTVLLVEQNVGNALNLCQHGCVIEHGQIRKSGTGQSLLHDSEVAHAYLGL